MIVIVDYGLGNLGSIVNMLKKIGAHATLSADASVIEKATKLILPGVGAFDHGMKNLTDLGLVPVLNKKVIVEKTPILGLCLGMQLFTRRSEEGRLPGLGWLDAETVRFRLDQTQTKLRVPHMGWNVIKVCQTNPIFEGLYEEARFYFVHSFHVLCHDAQDVLAQTHYGYEFPSVIGHGNIIGTQFHPEKSHKFGMKLLKNFVEYFSC
jgi:glutamine amidotransferase